MRHVLLKMYGCQYGKRKGTLVYGTKMIEELAARARYCINTYQLERSLSSIWQARTTRLSNQLITSTRSHVPVPFVGTFPLRYHRLPPLPLTPVHGSDPITQKGTSGALKP